MSTKQKIIPIFTTAGDVEAIFAYPYLFNLRGEWVGFVTPQKEVYSVLGDYIGWLSSDPRILRKRTYNYDKPKLTPPPIPPRLTVGGTMRLPPMMAELPYDTIDILQEEPDRLHTLDSGELKEDMD